ncbi:antibiotic biosynthesis monooxygenase [Massilia sp. CCM 8733]|uniref:Antibiotic biosynthesis monooxygenase n=1 Tax=Massilia mucilaginosa TaxID=2609282 RepID=A0ABX0NYJ5_9BURK|nr:antibiotic biosynthesis monooxygenase family protein [Massilia mucilaginosa]NHZ91843.1 antibiotic biosynthesis monooxygenase [Massilia mucilaginosa]
MPGTTFIITFATRPEAASDFRAMLGRVKHDLPAVAGCRGVSIFRASDDPAVFTLVEQWDSEQAHKAHIDTLTASGGWDAIAACLREPPAGRYARAL